MHVKTGLFFGSFNPVHKGHINVARQVLESTDIEEVWFVISPLNPHKTETDLWPVEVRIALLEAAISGEDRMKLCSVELDMPQPSYTIDTVRRLMADLPERSFVLLVGSDLLKGLSQWKESKELLRLLPLYVYLRPGYPVTADGFSGITVCRGIQMDISSTDIRTYLQSGKKLEELLPDNVVLKMKEMGMDAGPQPGQAGTD